MSENYHVSRETIKFFGKILEYPDGSYDIIASNRAVFGPSGWEESDRKGSRARPLAAPKADPEQDPEPQRGADPDPANIERARTRARSNVRRLALANQFVWFVTLTIDPEKIDSRDSAAVVKRLSQWCSNQVKRRGLRYVLVPEFHKSGRIHFHGFFNDALEAVDSGHTDGSGHPVYNFPGWGYGFTTGIRLYGSYDRAVAYVCKYIGKDSEKIGGRWYYSGGDLRKPVEKFVDIDSASLVESYGDRAWMKQTPGGIFAGVSGLKPDNEKGDNRK